MGIEEQGEKNGMGTAGVRDRGWGRLDAGIREEDGKNRGRERQNRHPADTVAAVPLAIIRYFGTHTIRRVQATNYTLIQSRKTAYITCSGITLHCHRIP